MISARWRVLIRKTVRVALYLAAVVYLLMVYGKLSSIDRSLASIGNDVYSIKSDSTTDGIAADLSDITSGDCQNTRICH